MCTGSFEETVELCWSTGVTVHHFNKERITSGFLYKWILTHVDFQPGNIEIFWTDANEFDSQPPAEQTNLHRNAQKCSEAEM